MFLDLENRFLQAHRLFTPRLLYNFWSHDNNALFSFRLIDILFLKF